MSCTRDGGKPEVKPLPYSPPKGPVQSSPGTNHGNSGTQRK